MAAHEERYQRWLTTAMTVWALIGILLLVAAALWGLGKIVAALSPFVIAFVIVFLLNWPVGALAARGMSRGMAVLLCFAVGFLILGGVLTVAGPFVVRQVVAFAGAVPTHAQQIQVAVTAFEERYGDIAIPQWLGGFVTSSTAQLSTLVAALGNDAAKLLVATGSGVATGVFDFIIAFIIAFWALRDLPKMRDELVVLVGPKYEADAEHLISTVTRVVGGYLKGQTIASTVTGLLSTVGLAILGVPYALVIGLIVFLLNYIPYVGPFTAGVIAALMGLLVSPWTAVFAVAVVIAAQQITDNLVAPRVMSGQVDLHPTLVIFSLLVGGTLFGVPGMVFAIPVAAIGKGLFVYYYEQRTDRQLTSEDGALFREAGAEPGDGDGPVTGSPPSDSATPARQ